MRNADNHIAYHPLVANFPMSWPPRGCNWCGADEMVWSYPVGHVNFPRENPADGEIIDMPHHAQQWFACARCKEHIDSDRLDELADLLGKPRGYWDRLMAARLKAKGYRWSRR
jgi:hypothetical protein